MRSYSVAGILVALLAACGDAARASEDEQAVAAAQTTSRMGVHGMVVTGTRGGAMYLSHIPMFHAPHDVQLVVEVRAEAPPSGVPASLSDRLYTWKPQTFSLDALRDGSLTRVRGTLYRGNFESGGRPIAQNVTFVVQRVVLDEVLRPSTPAPAEGVYVVVGPRAAALAVRVVGGNPGFDQVLAVRVGAGDAGAAPTDAELARGVRFTPAPSSGADAADRPRAGATLQDPARGLEVTIERELSCLVGPHFTESCP